MYRIPGKCRSFIAVCIALAGFYARDGDCVWLDNRFSYMQNMADKQTGWRNRKGRSAKCNERDKYKRLQGRRRGR